MVAQKFSIVFPTLSFNFNLVERWDSFNVDFSTPTKRKYRKYNFFGQAQLQFQLQLTSKQILTQILT